MSAKPLLIALLALLTTIPSTVQADESIGTSRWVGAYYFQYLGNESDSALWLYPHIDGVSEVYRVDRAGRWVGNLGSRYDPQAGRFGQRFNAAVVASEFAANGHARDAELLALYMRLHPSGRAPFYLRDLESTLEASLDDDARARVAKEVARVRTLRARVPHWGTSILTAPATLGTADDHYQALFADGYLDITIVGGNSFDEKSDKVHTAASFDELRAELGRQRYRPFAYRNERRAVLREKTIQFRGQPVRVRIQISDPGSQPAAIRQGVASFTEGLARADVVIYHGHSNGFDGVYYLSENKCAFSRFELGMRGQEDLARKCHELGSRGHQIVALQSCYSYEKYCRPISTYFAEHELDLPGFVGTSHRSDFDEFALRYGAFIQALTEGAGPRHIHDRMNGLRRHADSTPMLLRGVLQARGTFVVPEGVELGEREELSRASGNLVRARGSDGVHYYSTEVFPQDVRGEIVQVVLAGQHLYGVNPDGWVQRVGPDTHGAAVRVKLRHPVRDLAVASIDDEERLCFLDERGRVSTLGISGARPLGSRGLSGDIQRVGVDAQGRPAVLTDDSQEWHYDARQRRWVPASTVLHFVPSLRLDGQPSLARTRAPTS